MPLWKQVYLSHSQLGSSSINIMNTYYVDYNIILILLGSIVV